MSGYICDRHRQIGFIAPVIGCPKCQLDAARAAAPTEPPPGGETHVQADRAAALSSVPPPDRGAGLREAAQVILNRALDFFNDDDLYDDSSLAMPVVLKARDVARLRAALIDSEELDAAWAEAEAAWNALPLTEGSSILMLATYPGRPAEIAYEANGYSLGGSVTVSGPTPAAALRALAARLTKHPEEPA